MMIATENSSRGRKTGPTAGESRHENAASVSAACLSTSKTMLDLLQPGRWTKKASQSCQKSL